MSARMPALKAGAAGTQIPPTLPPDYDLVEVKGVSMAPELMPGWFVVIDRRHIVSSPPGMYMVDLGCGECPAYVESLASWMRLVRVWWADPRHPGYEVPPSEVTLRGRIVGVFRTI